MTTRRIDRTGEHRTAMEKNRQIILKTQRICGICGRPVDFSFRYPHPLSPSVDHIIPIAKGGHPSDLANLQLAHRCCNRLKSDKLYVEKWQREHSTEDEDAAGTAHGLPQHYDWSSYKPAAEDGDNGEVKL